MPDKKTVASQWVSPVEHSSYKSRPMRRYKKAGRPATFPNGRKYLLAVFDLFEARQVHQFCLSQNIDVARFLRVSAIRMLEQQGIEFVETAAKQDRDMTWVNVNPTNSATVTPSMESNASRESRDKK